MKQLLVLHENNFFTAQRKLFLLRYLMLPIILIPIGLTAQHQLGWRTDNYAGINAAFLNPAAPARTPYGWDLNIMEANFFLSNNYVFLENQSVPSILRAARNEKTTYSFRADLPAGFTPGEETVVYDFSENTDYYLQQDISVLGPSFSFRIAPMTRIGFFSRGRLMTSVKGLDQDLGYYSWNNILDNTEFTLNASRVTSAAWSETGMNLTQGFVMNNGNLHIGVSIRRLSGKRAAYFINKEDFTLSKLTNYTGLEGQQFDIEVGFTDNISETGNLNDSPGAGWGFDIGFLYQIDLGDAFYRWEIGGALLDVGRLNFTNAQIHRFDNETLASTLSDRYNNVSSTRAFESLTRILSQDVLGDSLASLQSDELVISLPATLSFQLTYHFNEWIKVGGNILTSVAPKGASLSRSTTVAIVPGMDRYWWGVAMPISLYAGEQLRLGLSARLGPFFIGTDQLGSFFKQQELSGTDLYLGVKFFPPGFSRRKGKKKAGHRRGRAGKEVKCYEF